jgi:predicted aspartyl protease
MTSSSTMRSGTEEREMGQITVELTIRNAFDAHLLRRGELPAASVRSVLVDDALVDTGAVVLCLPPALVEALGLELTEEVQVATASGYAAARLFSGAEIEYAGRRRTVDALELPGGDRVLLGAVPMEVLGVEPDLANRRLRLLPDHGPQTYLTIL